MASSVMELWLIQVFADPYVETNTKMQQRFFAQVCVHDSSVHGVAFRACLYFTLRSQ